MDHQKNKTLSLKSFIIIAVCSFTFVSLCMLPRNRLRMNAKRAQTFNNLKNLVIAMQDYASSDTLRSRMPYPVRLGASEPLPTWGESKENWSPEIVKLLFKNHHLSKGAEEILVSTAVTSGDYVPMELSEDLAAGGNADKMRWETDAELHFHVYSAHNLTNAANGSIVMGITYDQPDINNCLLKGEGWIVFLMDGSGGFKKRKFFGQYDFDSEEKSLLNKMAKENALKELKKIDSKATLRKVFGLNGNGGSTEIIGKKQKSILYQTFVDE